MKQLRVLVVDDHEVVRIGLRNVLATEPSLSVIADASLGSEAVRLAIELRPDVVLMDVRLPDVGGTEACRRIVEAVPACRVLMLTSYSDDEDVFASLEAGASGYLLKDMDVDALISAIVTVGCGGTVLGPQISGRVLQKVVAGPTANLRAVTSPSGNVPIGCCPTVGAAKGDLSGDNGHKSLPRPDEIDTSAGLSVLTTRELEILRLIAQGKTNQDIAQALFLSKHTVRNHVSSILEKLRLHNRTEAALFARDVGLDEPRL